MKRENINYTVVGLFVTVMLVVFFVVLYKVTGTTGPGDTYYVTYSNVTGVKYGTPVLYEGYQIGQVEEVTPLRQEGKTRYQLKLNVQKGWLIPSDSVASMVASGLLSAITIDIKEGQDREVISPGGTIQGEEATSIFTAVNDVAAELQTLSRDSVRPLLDNINEEVNSLSGELHVLISENIRPMVNKLDGQLEQRVMVDLADLLKKLNQSADRLLVVLDDENRENLDEFLANMQSASSTLNEVIFRIEDTRAAMNEVLLNIDGVLSDNQDSIKTSMNDLQKSLNIVSKNINTIVYHMEGSSRNIHELSRLLRENPSLIIKSRAQTDDEGSVE